MEVGISVACDQQKNNCVSDLRSYDLAIVGGGLAGLALSIQMARKGHQVILFEKEQYPFHRVCGEYISTESESFLNSLGTDLTLMHASQIRKLLVASSTGKYFEQALPLGGRGVSRYLLDSSLAKLAKESGVTLRENTRVNKIEFANESSQVHTAKELFNAKIVGGCFGKRSNLDIEWKRPFVLGKKSRLNNYIGVKYHVRCDFPIDTIALFGFYKGYCGLVKVEGDQYCLCYLTVADNLRQCDNNIEKMENKILSANRRLKIILDNCEKINAEPEVISQVSIEKKSLVEDHTIMIGDAAGMITPLCGNGMSIALHASKMAAAHMDDYLMHRVSRKKMEENYVLEWRKYFGSRMQTGRMLQKAFNHNWSLTALVWIGQNFPAISRTLIRQTHGSPFH
jgi:flavin-dependent dehydrogenase